MSTSVADPHTDVPARAAGAAGHCPGCATPLAGDERFCIACGLRVAPDELRLAALPLLPGPMLGSPTGTPALRRPVVRSAAVVAVVVLVFGIAVGATIGPAAVGQTAAAQRPVVLVAATPAAAPAAETDEPLDAGSEGDAPNDVQSLGDGADASADTAEPVAAAPAAETPTDDTASSGETPAADTPPDDTADTPPVAPPPGSQQLAGLVVGRAADGESFVLAARDGRLLHVHASGCGVTLGDDLHLRARPLANATWSADRVRRVGTSDAAQVAGTVVWADPAAGRYALGARGVTLFVTVPPPVAPPVPPSPPADGQTQPAAAPPAATPALGARLLVRVAATPAHDSQPAVLVEQARQDAPPPANPAAPAPPLELAGVVQAVDPQARTLTLALDPDAQPPLTVALSAPPQLDLARLLPAQRLAVTATAAPDGTLAVSGLSPDGDALAADDATGFQGDQRASTPADADQTTTTACTLLGAPERAAG